MQLVHNLALPILIPSEWLIVTINIFVAVVLIFLLLNSLILAPIKKITDSITHHSSGEQSTRIDLTGKTEIAALGNKLNEYIDDLQASNSQKTKQMKAVQNQSDLASEKITHLIEHMNEVALISENISNQAQKKLVTCTETTHAAQTLQNNIDSLSTIIDQYEQSFIHMQNKVNKGNKSMNDYTKMIADVAEKTRASKESHLKLAANIAKINDIVTTITDISEQTNLLALHASIEASKAGEEGKGFEGVANDVRKIAERSVHATNQISIIVEHILIDVQNTVKESEERVSDSQTISDHITDIRENFETIMTDIPSNTKLMRQINNQMTSLSDDSQKISALLEQIVGDTQATTDATLSMQNKLYSDIKE